MSYSNMTALRSGCFTYNNDGNRIYEKDNPELYKSLQYENNLIKKYRKDVIKHLKELYPEEFV